MTFTIVVIVIAVLAAVQLGGVLVARSQRTAHRHAGAEAVRGHAREEDRHVVRREARAEETGANARVAQAETDVKAAQAKGLQQQAAGHRSEAVASRDDLDEQFHRADPLDPAIAASDRRSSTHDEPHPTAR